jgi:clan AA aspartic protease (TIGR02281 family)
MRKLVLFFLLLFAVMSNAQTRVIMTNEGNGVYTIPCKVNGISLKFIFDTGASDVVISLSEARFMLKNGYLNSSDIVGTSYSQIANGQITENTKIILREIEIQGLKLYDVTASVIHELSAPLLLGQSAIQKLGKIQLNGNELIIYNVGNTSSECSFESIIPFKIGMSDFDISFFVLKNKDYKIEDDSFFASRRHHKEYVDYLKKEVDKGYLVVKKKFKNCINADITYRLCLVNDYLYRIEFDFGPGFANSDNISQMIANYNFLNEIIPETYRFYNETNVLDTETKVKIGEGVRYEVDNGEERKRKGLLNKTNCIHLEYSKSQLESSTGEPYYNAVLSIVDLRKTVLTNKGY